MRLSAYAPQRGRPDEEKKEFWENWKTVMLDIYEKEMLGIGANLHEHIGKDKTGFEDNMGI